MATQDTYARVPEAHRASGPVALRVEGLQKRYGAKEAVAGVSFEVREGEVFGLLGPNGAGKTTTIAMQTALSRRGVSVIALPGDVALRDAERTLPLTREAKGVLDILRCPDLLCSWRETPYARRTQENDDARSARRRRQSEFAHSAPAWSR